MVTKAAQPPASKLLAWQAVFGAGLAKLTSVSGTMDMGYTIGIGLLDSKLLSHEAVDWGPRYMWLVGQLCPFVTASLESCSELPACCTSA